MLKHVYIVCRIVDGKSGAALRAYQTADSAHKKLEDILNSLISDTPEPLLCRINSQRTTDGKLYAITFDDTHWNIKTAELRQ